MLITRHYSIAGLIFGIRSEEEIFTVLSHYESFLAAESEQTQMFMIHVTEKPMPELECWEHVYNDCADDDMPRVEMYRRGKELLFRFSPTREGEVVCVLQCSENLREGTVYMQKEYSRFAIDNATMLLFAIHAISYSALLFHASVVERDGKGVLFLGRSGTGKSTHARLWLETFSDAQLLNDDNPIVREMLDGEVRVFGSPWSGKTPCYKQANALAVALVQLVQAPANNIYPLRMAQAYPYILASVSGLKIIEEQMNTLYKVIAKLLEKVPVYKLECLPNSDAAILCAQKCLS